MGPPGLTVAFPDRCLERISSVFKARNLEPPGFRREERKRPYISGQFQHEGRAFEIEIYNDNVVMHQGERLFECYTREEFQSEESLIEGFATRLGRLLSGGPWDAPN